MNFYGEEILVKENMENGIYIEIKCGKYIVVQEELEAAHQEVLNNEIV